MSRILLETRSLTKSFHTGGPPPGVPDTVGNRLLAWRPWRPANFHVFENVSFTLRAGEAVGLLGGNGSGKSTFLRCVAGVLQPNGGKVVAHGRVAALLSHGFGAYEELPVRRNIVLAQQLFGSTRQEAEENVGRVAALAGLSDRIKNSTSHLSEGMRAKISLAALAHAEFDVALLDESLNHVDVEFRDMYLGLTRKWISDGRAVVLTSHDDGLLHRFSNRLLRAGNKTLTEAAPPG